MPDNYKYQDLYVISGWTVRDIASACDGLIRASLDLGISHSRVCKKGDSLILPDAGQVSIAELGKEASGPQDCVYIRDGHPFKMYMFSEQKGKYYKLYQHVKDMAPTVVINNATMHTIKGRGPWHDVKCKIDTVPAGKGPCLDTCCGPGYSAQFLARKSGDTVFTCEVDEEVLTLATYNPWSRGLFTDERIKVFSGDVRTFIQGCAAGDFSVIFHDPPTVFQAGELYSEELYRRFAELLRRGGVLYHYIGTPGKKQGKDFEAGVIKRLKIAGFRTVRRCYGGVEARL